VLTHGFTMDAKGMKMSKSLGNTISPIDLMRDYGADILRLWALSVDFTEDHRIGKEILAGVADQYRKLRNTFRYLLGALEGFDEAERLPVADMPELERYVLARLSMLDTALAQAVEDFDFNTYVRALSDFCNEDLSAFYFDIRKDSLYCDSSVSTRRRACRTVLDTLFHALVRYAAPVLVFTAEEVWGTRYPEAGSVHLLEWPTLPDSDEVFRTNDPVAKELWVSRWNDNLRQVRREVNLKIEQMRRDKLVGSSLEANVTYVSPVGNRPEYEGFDFAELLIVSGFTLQHGSPECAAEILVMPTTHHKCGRCWRHLPDVAEDGALCARCDDVVAQIDSLPA